MKFEKCKGIGDPNKEHDCTAMVSKMKKRLEKLVRFFNRKRDG